MATDREKVLRGIGQPPRIPVDIDGHGRGHQRQVDNPYARLVHFLQPRLTYHDATTGRTVVPDLGTPDKLMAAVEELRQRHPQGLRAPAIAAFRAARHAHRELLDRDLHLRGPARDTAGGTSPGTAGDSPGTPGLPPPAPNWIPIGPSAVYPWNISGRVASLAIVPMAGGSIRIYAGTANGGVWRSDDGGVSWVSTMDSLPTGPAVAGADSLACGAVAVSPVDPNKLFVGTGEGHPGSGVYYGIGPMRTDNAGGAWTTEPTAAGSPPLSGTGTAGLAVDPAIPDRVVLASTGGLYRREPDGSGGFHWVQKRPGYHSAVVVARTGGVTTFYAAAFGGQVYSSTDGATWTAIGTATWPTGTLGFTSLGVRASDPSVLYAMIASSANASYGSLIGLYRYDSGTARWTQVTGVPDIFASGSGWQGWYDNCIAVDPSSNDLIYIGGIGLYRCSIAHGGGGASVTYSTAPTAIGGVHSDIHHLQYLPGDSTRLFVGCDGGVYSTDSANTTATFTPRNVGLATLEPYHGDHHPNEDAVLFIGTQDNGTQRYNGDEAWQGVAGGDGGSVLVNQANPYELYHGFFFTGASQSEDGGGTWPTDVSIPDAEQSFYPIAARQPAGSSAPREIAVGSQRPWISTTFGGGWVSIPNNTTADRLPYSITALAWATPDLLYAASYNQVYKYVRAGSTWSAAQTVGGTLPLPVLSIAVDPADASNNSLYVALGGSGTYQHVQHWNGSAWSPRSGASGSATALIDVQYNAIVVDPANPTRLYAGGELGVWRSLNSGSDWTLMSDGLPDAAVRDLRLHAGRRLLRAFLHGRGVWEWNLDAGSASAVELYMRDTLLDRGRYNTADGAADPTVVGGRVWHWHSVDIKVDSPSSSGTYQTPTTSLTFFDFASLVDGANAVATVDPSVGEAHNRVYVQVHNRGVQPASAVRAMLLLTNASLALQPLPANYWTNVQNGTAISTADWQTVGIVSPIDNLAVGFPRVAYFDLHSSMLPPPSSLGGNSHFCALALIHCPTYDPFTSTETDVNILTVSDRKVAQKNLQVVAFSGTLPPSPGIVPLMVGFTEKGLETELVVDRGSFRGHIGVVLPEKLAHNLDGHERADAALAKQLRQWHGETLQATREHAEKGTYSPALTATLLRGIEEASEHVTLLAHQDVTAYRLPKAAEPGGRHVFLTIEPPKEGGAVSDVFHVYQRDPGSGRITGGTAVKVIVEKGA